MKRTKIAPILRHFISDLSQRTDTGWLHGFHVPRAAQQLRALLAVARAVDGVIEPEDEGDSTLLPTWRRLLKARARLRRLSAPPVKGSRKLPANSGRARPGARRTRTP